MPGSIKTEEIVQGFVGWTWLNKNRRTYYKELMGSLFSTKEISMKEIRCCFIKEQYFIDNSDFINMLDSGNVLKQSQRTHLCIELKSERIKCMFHFGIIWENHCANSGKLAFQFRL